ncbi:MAG: LysM peptidoglycan-binding domain-containing protein [Verrucomicrobiales bacterium]|nr:LysM peptidoglycan-binding domain-containing protein [Verrucomicrobiales bacterium]
MNRIATTLTTLVGLGLLLPTADAADPVSEQINARLSKIEARLSSLESSLAGETGSYSYSDQATLEATRGNEAVKTETSPAKTYLIKDGDTLGSIARDHGVERDDLLAANRLSEGQPIYIGETLVIPGAEVPVTEEKSTKIAETPKPADATKKSVVVGETKKAPEQGTKTHTVAKGDTLTSIARVHGTDVKTLKATNGLKSDVISLGQTLKLPAGKVAAATTASNNAQDAAYEYDNPLLKADETYGYYTVRKGDNLYALARDFFSSMSELQRLNHLGSSTLIHPGDELIVPTSEYNAYHNQGEMAQR